MCDLIELVANFYMTVEHLIAELKKNYKLYNKSIYFDTQFEIVDFAYDRNNGLMLFADNEFQNGITPKQLLPQLYKVWKGAKVSVICNDSFCPIASVSPIAFGDDGHINLFS